MKLGHISASRVKDVLSNGRGKGTFGATAMTYANELALIRLGVPPLRFQTKATEWGVGHESEALCAFESFIGQEVYPHQQFVQHHTMHYLGCTPDASMSELVGVEVKCPFNPLNHLADLRSDERLKGEYYAQVQCQIEVMGWREAFIVSYDPSFPTLKTQIVAYTWELDNEFIGHMLERIAAFEIVVNEIVSELKNK
ncbi:MAG: hypothetical protein GC193_13200 [Cryomorphaceae bacterium]|nr:hypothetical protein [Cryomorphaceae bacterium]